MRRIIREPRLFVCQIHDIAQLKRQRLRPRVDLRIDRSVDCDLQRRAYGGHAMSSHQNDRRISERAGQCFSESGVPYQQIALGARDLSHLERRYSGAQEPTGMAHRAEDDARNDREWHDRGRMTVDDGLNIRARSVDTSMDEALGIERPGLRLDWLAGEVKFDHGLASDLRGCHACGHEEAILPLAVTGADVTVCIDDSLIEQDVIGYDEIVNEVRA